MKKKKLPSSLSELKEAFLSARRTCSKRHLAAALAVSAAGLTIAFTSTQLWASVSGTKHNLGSLSTAAVKTTETSEVCVFCHTPHNAAPSGPVWNKQDTGATYNVYESQTLAATLSPNSPTLGQPTGSSKLCLSCHDGTIALGSLLNQPGKTLAGTFSVTGTGVTAGKLTSASTSYIGTDLKDDHPISFEYSLAYPSNPEIKSDTLLPPNVKVDSSGRIQCTSCHDPHGTAYPKFMVSSLESGVLCLNCHEKRFWETNPSIHKTSTATWNGNGVNPWHEDMGSAGFSDDTPQMQSCLACHRSHNGTAGKSLLKGINPATSQTVDEEWTCLNCHNGNVTSKDVEPQFSYLYKHNIKGTYGSHIASRQSPGEPARESAANLGNNRHAECADCHNSHATKSGNHTIGGVNGNIIAPNVLGSWGVKPSAWPSAGNQALTYTVTDFNSLTPGSDNLEGYLCIKCHSYYSYGVTNPSVPSGNADGSLVLQSDPTADFNVNNMSYHPVFAQGKNQPFVSANPNWPANNLGLTNTFRYVDFPGVGQRTGFFNVTHDSTSTCTDCHSSSVTADPKGAHGSDQKWILNKNQTGSGSLVNFCYNCHRRDVYGDEGYVGPNANFSRVPHPVDGLGTSSPFYTAGSNTGNNSNKFGILCLSCHGGSYDSINNVMKGVHGSNAAAGALAGSDPLGYRLMNGACVESHKRATTSTGVEMNFRSVTPATDKVCNYNFTNFIGVTATYNCNTVSTCAN
ncbi:MAG: hypothetical protein HYS21_09450 [Deltaproteobacteria bacterium]|nr:hypothetical protein [Deltaproteobacteria bacterium]